MPWRRTSTPYSFFRRVSSTSSCSTPTTPQMTLSMPKPGSRKICTAPSWASSCMPFTNCLRLSVFTCVMRAKCSGENVGMGGNCTCSPLHTVSPMLKMPGSNRPTMSPAYASSTVARSSAMSDVPVASFSFLPPCTWNASMPRSNLPEQMRTNAMRSRWFLSMFAWILNTKPANSLRCGSTRSPEMVSV